MEWKVEKKGWLKMKTKIAFLNVYQAKWIVLYSEPVASLAVFEKCCHSTHPYNPKHHLMLNEFELKQIKEEKFTIIKKSSNLKVRISNNFSLHFHPKRMKIYQDGLIA